MAPCTARMVRGDATGSQAAGSREGGRGKVREGGRAQRARRDGGRAHGRGQGTQARSRTVNTGSPEELVAVVMKPAPGAMTE